MISRWHSREIQSRQAIVLKKQRVTESRERKLAAQHASAKLNFVTAGKQGERGKLQRLKSSKLQWPDSASWQRAQHVLIQTFEFNPDFCRKAVSNQEVIVFEKHQLLKPETMSWQDSMHSIY